MDVKPHDVSSCIFALIPAIASRWEARTFMQLAELVGLGNPADPITRFYPTQLF